MDKKFLTIKNATEHNLKNLSVKIPKNKLVIITGVSGSGKSSLAFDIIYNEGKRRYIDSLSNYARQFLGITTKPNVESIEGLSPTIAIDQKVTSNNPRSTVGTITEIYDFYRLLFARIGVPYCPNHNIAITSQTITQIVDNIFTWKEQTRIQILIPLVIKKQGMHQNLIEKAKKEGFVRLKIDGVIYLIDEIDFVLEKNKKHDIFIVVDRLIVNEKNEEKIFDSVNFALDYNSGLIYVENLDDNHIEIFSTNFACKYGDFSMPLIEPKLFSFNSPYGACDHCNGLGFNQQVTWKKLVDENKTILEGGIKYFGDRTAGWEWKKFSALFNYYNIPLDRKLKHFLPVQRDIIMYGSKEPIEYKMESDNHILKKYEYIEGVATLIERRFLETTSETARNYYQSFLGTNTCSKCHGARLNDSALSIKINGINIYELSQLSIERANEWILNLKLSKFEREVVDLVVQEIKSRFSFLINVGLGYLTLNRIANTLSGGEAQRIRLASQLGSKLTGVLYILDEPSIGLHQRDNAKLIDTLKEIRDLDNTVIVVEHDEETMLEADHIIDIGPDAGEFGGEIVGEGNFKEIQKNNTHTGNFLSGRDLIKRPEKSREKTKKYLTIVGAREHNLKNFDLEIPLNQMVVVTGVSGSGKSTLINDILYKHIHNTLSKESMFDAPGEHDWISGVEHIDKIIKVSQSPIGKTPRSNPATYTGIFDDIRDIFSSTQESKIRGFKKGQFSFNVRGGRCDKCDGDGLLKISMHFLPDVYVKCDICDGKRYNSETLKIKYKGKNIYDVLNMSVKEALVFFANYPKLQKKISYLYDVGLGYIKLGHPSTMLSGGEAQRIKLATYLQKRPTGKTLYILDEPSTGLHNHDIKKLIEVLNRIVDNGDSMIIIEHNLDIIKIADFIIDLGPEGGEKGGEIIAKGTPEQIMNSKRSYTGKYLKKMLESRKEKL